MDSKNYAFHQLTEAEKPQAGTCQRAYCQEISEWKATIPVKRYNGFTRNIFLCERHKVKLWTKIAKKAQQPEPCSIEGSVENSEPQFEELEELD